MSTGEDQGGGPAPAEPKQTYDTKGQPSSPEQGSSSGGCTSCDLAEIETLSCTAKKFGRQSEVIDEVATSLETWKTQFDAARQKYADARTAAAADLNAIRDILDGLAEQLRCRLKDDQRSCLEQACEEVFRDLDECTGPRGCQSPCDTTDPGPLTASNDVGAIAAEIERRRRNLTESAAYFVALVAEPGDITQQVGALKTEATKLASDVAAGGDSEQPVRWYARWLILNTAATLDRLGRGFASVTAYVDCLCGVLRCIVSGWTHLAELEGRKAELDCHDKAKQDACDKKRKDTLQAVLDAYEECCKKAGPGTGQQPCDDSTGEAASSAASAS